MKEGVWDGLPKERVLKGVTTALGSPEFMETLAEIYNAEKPAEIDATLGAVKDMMSAWREEAPEYAFMIDCLFHFAEQSKRELSDNA